MKYLIYFLLPLLLLSCGKEQESNLLVDNNSEGVKETYTIPYSAIINGSEVTRATLGEGGTFASSYVFQSGDRLFVSYESGGNSLYGVLTLEEGVGTSTGEFEGDLTCSAGFYPGASNPVIYFTLVGVNAATGFYTISDNKITAGPSYPSVIDYTSETLAGMVEKYSHFTASGNFTSNSFILQQQSVFLNFSIKFDASALGGSTPEAVSVSLKPSSDGTPIFTANNVSLADGRFVSFTGVFQAGDDLQGQGIYVSGIHCEPDFAADLTLAANKYYSVERNTFHWDGFRIKAKEDGTTMTFKYTYSDGEVQFSTDSGATWTNYDGRTFNMSAGDEICFKGNRENCDCNGTTQLFSANKVCYIAGKIGSLLANDSSLAQYAFRSAFSNGNSENTNPAAVTFVDIDSADPLILPSVTSNNCYREMFRACTSLTNAPELPAESLSQSCYKSMFEGCTSLSSVPMLPATTLAASCYEGMFSNCTSITSLPSDLLPATTLADMCYHRMFQYCALTTLPEGLLPAQTMAFGCYWKMFEDCRSLVTVPNNLLPAMTLATACYARMFFRCIALQRGPDLPAINPAPACYFVMFRNCAAIKYVKCMLYLNENQRNGKDSISALSSYNKTEDPPEDNLRTWTVIDFWTVFNKWLTKSQTNGFNVPNDNTCEYVYNSSMPDSIFSISIAGATLVPSNWKKTPVD